MNAKEIVKANIEFACDDRIGFRFSETAGRMNDFRGAGYRYPESQPQAEDETFEYSLDMWGNTWRRIKGMSARGEIFKPVLENWSDLDAMRLPELDNPACYEHSRAVAKAEKERFTIGGIPWPFEVCRYMRRMDNYLMDLVAERERIDALHERIATLLEGVIDRFGEAGIDGLMITEDLGVQDRLLMSPSMWRDIFRPLYERLTSRAHGYGMKVILHSCGYNWALIDDLCESGVDCLQFDQPTLYDMPDLAEKLKKHRVGLFSPCDIQRVLPTGNRTLIESETLRLVETFRGGFIAKEYGDLHGIGVQPEWDQWAYDTFVKAGHAPRFPT